ncbi:DUF1398 domain-containing protein [Flavobacterium sp. UMI-01]|uniref:DUF1398 domain-containing protein n=1 Tax=Flavobacterium sp. UMI-01 TaxID=1441053 RepID=UPI001C7D1CCF|nr:DUF1398 family protein [Flavobacterium sp. UMI-01]GIZ08647.1 hypothetical protein FUMI01_13740 [Flavobacterium sp. UMI-01]
MFTIKQIKAAHDKVQTGADFPKYISDLIQLGVKSYTTVVEDGSVVYTGADGFEVSTEKKYTPLTVSPLANKERFIEFLVMHQDGQTDYFSFCNHAAQCGIAKWEVDIVKMNCTYYDSAHHPILIENIPL